MYIHLHSKENIQISGLSTPGLPTCVIGHTANVAWSITLGISDIADIFVERFEKKEGSNKYQVDGEWKEAKIYHEKINIKGVDTPHEFDVAVTRHGPVLEPLSGLLFLFVFCMFD